MKYLLSNVIKYAYFVIILSFCIWFVFFPIFLLTFSFNEASNLTESILLPLARYLGIKN